MSKRLLYALILIGAVVLVLVANGRGRADVDFFFTSIEGLRALVYLGFTAVGVAIGILLK